MGKKDASEEGLRSPRYYLNRELSWLEFNDRVLREGLNPELPLLERLKFLAIVSSNLDEFFMIRVAALKQVESSEVHKRDPAGMTATQQLRAIRRRVRRMVQEHAQGLRSVLNELAKHRIQVLRAKDWTDDQRQWLRRYFQREIQDQLSPMNLSELDSLPLLPGLRLQIAALVDLPTTNPDTAKTGSLVIVPVPSQCKRFVELPSPQGVQLACLEDVIAENLDLFYTGRFIKSYTVFRITRDADVPIQDDDASDLLINVRQAVSDRSRRAIVRMEIAASTATELIDQLCQTLQVPPEAIYRIEGLLDASCLWELIGRKGYAHLRLPDWPPQTPQDLLGHENLWEAIQEHDVLLFHPYESFQPVIQLLQEAAEDPQVLAIKQTLYRTSGDSPVVRSLERAAQNGKQVTVLVELKARFEEARNLQWASRLEDAGCYVLYGLAGLKTHAKALLIVRREADQIRRYVHLSTGNYNERTAQQYSDIGLLSCDRDLAADVAALFNLLTGQSEPVGWNRLVIAPTGLRQHFLDLIYREAELSTPEQPGLIMAKVNALQDQEICQALYQASQKGVKILLNVRGICILRPGLPGISENIEVISIVDRFLEHARIFYFQNGGHEEVYLGSADWMTRNLDRRLEILFPVVQPNLRRRLIEILKTFFADNVKAWRLLPDGTYQRVPCQGEPIRAQEVFYKQAVAAVREAEQIQGPFRPLARPQQQ
ncbi:MAG: polyphosphate kinase 1 [Thermoguttaceae bacterium]|nr:polyphosphate kinase 1 [Thermoguttaceae bacterium]MDW8036777.1 polyphosphate kinase 1 [Thermoguttaceae bacterium]